MTDSGHLDAGDRNNFAATLITNEHPTRPAVVKRREWVPAGCSEKPVGIAEGRGLDRAVQHQQLVPQCEVLQDEVTTGVKSCGQASQDRKNE